MFKQLFIIICAFSYLYLVNSDKTIHNTVVKLAERWANQIGASLTHLSETMTRSKEAEENFKFFGEKMYKINGNTYVTDIATKIRVLMDKKSAAVNKIAQYAEFLSYYRPDDPLFPNSSYYYFDADNVTNNENEKLTDEIIMSECQWWCYQENLKELKYNFFKKSKLEGLFRRKNNYDQTASYCDCGNVLDTIRPPAYYYNLPMEYDKRFDTEVNLNLSITKVVANVYNRDQSVLEGVRWSEALDLVFKENMANDPSLTWQYFASPRGFMRHYPAIKWSDEQYDKTYDFRTRSWYTEAMTSPKDIIILLDRSGSMTGEKIALSRQIVNNILDTLNDNDFVNIYTFTNTTEPVVSCFNDTLVQANEENLRLLRESLTVYSIEFAADLTIGFKKAFQILKKFRKHGGSAQCNQAIMIITEGVDYYYDTNLFKENNWDLGSPVRVFTYQIGSSPRDARQMEWIACANKGYFVNMTFMPDIREKVLNYLNVMSRPINGNYQNRQKDIWSYLHVDLADRRFSNWLWRKYEGIRQREVFLDHVKRHYRWKKKMLTSEKHMLLRETHDFQKYEKKIDYNYMTTVSQPVYGRRSGEIDLIGVAGVDVPIKLIKSLIDHHKLGVNGYAFIVTNNGYVLMHPDHRQEFENILKPTFNRVDLLEVEIVNDDSEPRMFNEAIVNMRENIVSKTHSGEETLSVKFTLHEMKRVILSSRQYFFTKTGPFSLGIVLPKEYGSLKVDTSFHAGSSLESSNDWKVHPDWNYCEDCKGRTPEEKIVDALSKNKKKSFLLKSLLSEANATNWFNQKISNATAFKKFNVNKIFLATQSGLTRWDTFNDNDYIEADKDSFEIRNNRAIDEDWYRRAVEENYKDESMFIYSVPFEISGYENNTMITGTKAVFVRNGTTKKTPIAVVGLQFNHRAMYKLYNDITTQCGRSVCNITCESDYLNCFILDNNAYIILSDEIEYTGRYIGDIRPDIMYHLINDGVYQPTRMFDYQAICQKLPPEKKKKNSASRRHNPLSLNRLIHNVWQITNWIFTTMWLLVQNVMAGPDYQSLKEDTIGFETLEIKKTLPTPCDHEMWLFNLKDKTQSKPFYKITSKFDCEWPYVMHKIPNTNLLFVAINGICKIDTQNTYNYGPTPKEIVYNETLPCYIATKNNYSRKVYMDCYKHDIRENKLNEDHFYCGHTWQ